MWDNGENTPCHSYTREKIQQRDEQDMQGCKIVFGFGFLVLLVKYTGNKKVCFSMACDHVFDCTDYMILVLV